MINITSITEVPKKAGRGSDQFVVRMPPLLRDVLRIAAERNGRSMNSEILAALYKHLGEPE